MWISFVLCKGFMKSLFVFLVHSSVCQADVSADDTLNVYIHMLLENIYNLLTSLAFFLTSLFLFYAQFKNNSKFLSADISAMHLPFIVLLCLQSVYYCQLKMFGVYFIFELGKINRTTFYVMNIYSSQDVLVTLIFLFTYVCVLPLIMF